MSNKEKEQNGISRREFVKGVGIGAAVVAGTAIAQPLAARGGPGRRRRNGA
jgi:hypothetical protein